MGSDWNQLWKLFHDAVELAPDAREAFIARACEGDEELRAELESLVAAHDNDAADALLEGGIASVRELDPRSMVGRSIGPYRITDILGEGGMGVVYSAEQSDPIRRTVALKLIQLGMNSREVVARFESERQALALMSHPNIARAYDAGASEDGRPYFVMEYVPGIPITDYCDRRQLTIAERLRLFLKVCDGVQHAHHKGIIHRDLKPSNILVVEDGERAEPKIIDFGVAKALTERLTTRTLYTRIGRIIGTPSYISPEQAEMGGLGIDTRSDIYTLGVLLYEMTVGSRPFDDEVLRNRDPASLTTFLRDSDPPRPSSRITAGDDDIDSVARRRSTTRERLLKAIRGDLDWIILKALEPDRSRRYASVDEFARDLENYFENKPVSARPPSTGYRLQKFVARNRLLVGAAGVLVVAVIISIVGLTAGLIQARQAQAIAETERNNAEVISGFLESILIAASPYVADGADTELLVELLDNATTRIDTELADQPLLAAELQDTIANTYRALGMPGKAETTARAGIENLETLGARDSGELGLSLQNRLSLALWAQGKNEESLGVNRRIVGIQRDLLGPTHNETMSTLNNIGLALKALERFDEAEAVWQELVELKTEEAGAKARTTIITRNNLANLYRDTGRLDEAEAVMRSVVDDATASLGPDDPDTLVMRDSYANILARLGRLGEAEIIHRDVIERMSAINGPDHTDTLGAIYHLGQFYMETGDPAQAEASFRHALSGVERSLGPNHRFALFALNWLGQAQMQQSDWSGAEASFRRLLDAAEAEMAESSLVPQTQCRLGRVMAEVQQSEEARMLLENCVPALLERFGANDENTIAARRALEAL